MIVDIPRMDNHGQWTITVREDRSPLSKVIERIPCGNRDSAWVEFRRIRTALAAMNALNPPAHVHFKAKVVLIAPSGRATMYELSDGRKVWLPNKEVKTMNHGAGLYQIPAWLARDKEIR